MWCPCHGEWCLSTSTWTTLRPKLHTEKGGTTPNLRKRKAWARWTVPEVCQEEPNSQPKAEPTKSPSTSYIMLQKPRERPDRLHRNSPQLYAPMMQNCRKVNG